MWEEDSKIDSTDLGGESLRIPSLHAKYCRLYSLEKVVLTKLKGTYKSLRLEKYEFLINPTKEKVDLGWIIPPQGKLIKSEVGQYLESDTDLINLELQLSVQQEKVDMLKSILDTLKTRGLLIKNALDDRRFLAGG